MAVRRRSFPIYQNLRMLRPGHDLDEDQFYAIYLTRSECCRSFCSLQSRIQDWYQTM